jgi:2-polyprenyl-3-methyl-5-hydroxy-6-metoxy-1,4-benzoquinol methylase
MIKRVLQKMFESAMILNRKNILDSLPHNSNAKLLDLGCDEGTWTLKLADRIGTTNIHGVEIVQSRAEQARLKGVCVTIADLSCALPFVDKEFDVIHANQVIEHVPDVDVFASEIFRALKPGGHIVISTENASSWHNVFAMVLGWQMFSLTNMSGKVQGIGNPAALHRGSTSHLKSWTHKVIFSHRGLIEFFQAHGFDFVEAKGAGYYPFPSWFGKIDVRHSHFLTLVARRKNSGV